MNDSKKKDSRFWKIWRNSGAVYGIIISSKKSDYVAEAKDWLGYARNRTSSNESDVKYIREYIAKAGVTLESIGTSEEELGQLLLVIA